MRLATVEDRLLDVGREKCEPQDVAIVGRGWCSFQRWQPSVSGDHGVSFAQRGNQYPILLWRASLGRSHKMTTPAGREDDRQQDGHTVGGAVKDDLVICKPGHKVGTVRGFESQLQSTVVEVD